MNKRLLGRKYERIAEKILVKSNHCVIYKNFYTKYGELDLVTIKDMTLNFFEVKYSSSFEITSFDHVSEQKVRNMKRASLIFISQYNLDYFDAEYWVIGFDVKKQSILKIS
jgi:putative endonuclease